VVDAAELFKYGYKDDTSAERYREYAVKVRAGIQAHLWDASRHNYLPFVGAKAADWKKWYPDATAQLFPILDGVIDASAPQARTTYAEFNAKWPKWEALRFPGREPWVTIACAAAIEGDNARVSQYISVVEAEMGDRRSINMETADLGWLIRLDRYMLTRENL